MIDVASLLDVWGSAIWRASWQGSLAVLAIWLVCRLRPSLPARCQSWLWRIALLKFLVAFVWSAPIELPLLPAPQVAVSAVSENIPGNAASQESLPWAQLSEPGRYHPLPLLFAAWIVMVSWQWLKIVAAGRKARGLLSICRPCDDRRLQAQLAALMRSAGIRCSPELLEMDGSGSPLLVGLLRPAIVLPRTTLDRLDDTERSMVLCHELAHLRRGDLMWGLFAAMVRAVFGFHPLAWLCERQMRLTAEMAADELAMTLENHNPVGYAAVLVSVLGKLGPDRPIPAISVGMTGSHNSLQQSFLPCVS